MQTSELEKNKNHINCEEECINFRPSPNFKHMKKYLKSKFEEANSSPNQGSDPSTTPNSDEQETVKPQQASASNMAERAQPPLPPNSPPPEFLIVPKQEVEDKDYNEKPVIPPKVEPVEVVKKAPTEIMCRQFARGMCTRGASCIYVHKTILDQLPGVYTFCKNFQNTVCTLPKCKFVHATVFEKEHYYRTGFLPPHALAHLRESNSALGPPRALEGTPNDAPNHVINPLPPMHPGMSSMPLNVAPDGRPNPEMYGHHMHIQVMKVNKREWSETDLALTAHEDTNGHVPRKCKMCDVTELRLERAKDKMEMLMEESAMLAKQKKQLMKNDARINQLFDVMLFNEKEPHSSRVRVELEQRDAEMAMRNEADIQARRLAVPRRSNENNRRLMLELEMASRLRNMDLAQQRLLSDLLKIVQESKRESIKM